MKTTGREGRIRADMESLGIYSPAFDDAIHAMATLERELSRARKAWKATAKDGEAPSMLNPLYKVICQLRGEVMSYQDALGLTPKGLRKLRGNGPDSGTSGGSAVGKALDDLESFVGGYEVIT